jgi:photosystem II stability/assembly factor-like uncharacterized protein
LFFTPGPQSGLRPQPAPFVRSIDGGRTWIQIPNVLEVHSFGFGKARTVDGYPAIFIAGWVNRVYGLWRSDDAGTSWVAIGDFPLGILDDVKAVEGDKSAFGKVYVGFAGSGYAYGELAK